MSEQEIHCRDCQRYEKPAGEGDPFGFCTQYDTNVEVDKYLLSCPGAVRVIKDVPAPKSKKKTGVETDVMAYIEGLSDQMTDIQSAQHVLDGKIFDQGKRQDQMERKINMLIDVVGDLTSDGKPTPTKIQPEPEKDKTPAPGPAITVVKRVIKKKAKKKTKKKP